jgi:Flp pilus assembly protein TadG
MRLNVSTKGDQSTAFGVLKHTARAEAGSVLVESAFTISLLLMLIIGIFWIARGYNVYSTMGRAAREGARFAVTPSCAMCGNQYPPDDQVRQVISDALQASALNPDLVTPNPISIQRDVILNPGSAQIEKGVVITFTYPYQIFLPFTSVGLSNYTLTAQVQMREEK